MVENKRAMRMRWLWRNWLAAAVLVMAGAVAAGGASVSYDGRSLIIDGQRKMLFSGSIHYPRSTPDVCPSLSLLIFVILRAHVHLSVYAHMHIKQGRNGGRLLR